MTASDRTHYQFLLIFCTVLSSVVVVTATALANGYLGVPWQAGYPEVEKKHPTIVFESENAFHLTTFSMSPPDRDIASLELKFFKNRLTAVVQKYSVSLAPFMNEKYLRTFLSVLGKRQKVENRKITKPQGMTDTTLWDYGDVLVFFQTYPLNTIKGAPQPSNIVKFVHKPTFKDMMRYIKNNPDGDPDALEDDFDAVSF